MHVRKLKASLVMKKQDIYRGYKDPWLDEFEHRFTCWASRRNQWAKAQKFDKRIAKKRERRNWKKEIPDD